ncbi:hypothetical protein SB6419_01533 [Klebsiella spallanzanii]|nr:hypothetical protein SB6419_01533 [Klebsiella spallanzanii]
MYLPELYIPDYLRGEYNIRNSEECRYITMQMFSNNIDNCE